MKLLPTPNIPAEVWQALREAEQAADKATGADPTKLPHGHSNIVWRKLYDQRRQGIQMDCEYCAEHWDGILARTVQTCRWS